jgi:Ca2+-binding RTX toxin-like protein
MKRIAILGVLVGTLLLLTAGGAALAANQIECPNRDGGRCIGTPQPDEMIGGRGDDTIRGRAGADTIDGRRGSDELHGEVGGDTIVAARCALGGGADVFGGRGGDDITITSDCGDLAVVPPPDRVDCGPGYDVVRGAVPEDRIADDCERVVPQRSF